MVPRTKIINSGCHQSVGSRSAQALERSASSSSGMKVFTILPTTNTQSPKTHGFSSVCVPITNYPVPENWHNDVHKLKLIHNVMQNGSDFRSSDVSLKGKLLFDEGKLAGPVTHLSLAARSRECIKTCSAVASVALPNSRAHARTQDKYKHTHTRTLRTRCRSSIAGCVDQRVDRSTTATLASAAATSTLCVRALETGANPDTGDFQEKLALFTRSNTTNSQAILFCFGSLSGTTLDTFAH